MAVPVRVRGQEVTVTSWSRSRVSAGRQRWVMSARSLLGARYRVGWLIPSNDGEATSRLVQLKDSGSPSQDSGARYLLPEGSP